MSDRAKAFKDDERQLRELEEKKGSVFKNIADGFHFDETLYDEVPPFLNISSWNLPRTQRSLRIWQLRFVFSSCF